MNKRGRYVDGNCMDVCITRLKICLLAAMQQCILRLGTRVEEAGAGWLGAAITAFLAPTGSLQGLEIQLINRLFRTQMM